MVLTYLSLPVSKLYGPKRRTEMTRKQVDFQRFYDFLTTIYTNLPLPGFRKWIKIEAANEV